MSEAAPAPLHRFAADAPHGFGGAELDRSRPLKFRLNGRQIEGFAGDTVLSAALATGVLTAGRHGDEALGLDERFAPLLGAGRGAPLPMERTPALDGVDYSTLGQRRDLIASRGLFGALRNMLVGPARTLNHRYGDSPVNAAPWQGMAPEANLSADVAVIGGGVAGLAAAAAAVAAGKRVVLVERQQSPGGVVRYFGATEGEPAPDTTIARLVGSLQGKGEATLLSRAEAFAVSPGSVRVHQVLVENGSPRGRVVTVTAPHIVLATGASERLPLFPGNRAPGVVGSVAAFQRAERYGVWAGRRALFNTPQSPAYRLALHAHDAGAEVQRIVDTRIQPHSRFIDFCKAVGITLASGLVASHAQPLQRNRPGLSVGFAVAIAEITQDSSTIETDQLIVAGGWQPEIMLWLRAGGAAAWDAENRWLAPRGSLPGIALCGAAAGYHSTGAAIASGRAAVLGFLGKTAPPVEDKLIAALYETPDAPTPVAPYRSAARGATYLDRGPTLLTRRAAAAGKHGISGLATRPVQMGLGDLAAAVDIGAMAPRDAGTVAAERCALAAEIADSGWRVEARVHDAATTPPAYLAGRFGEKPQLWVLAAADARSFEPGGLIYENSETGDPLQAIGITFAPPPETGNGGIAVLARVPDAPGAELYVRDAGTAVAARLVERLKAK